MNRESFLLSNGLDAVAAGFACSFAPLVVVGETRVAVSTGAGAAALVFALRVAASSTALSCALDVMGGAFDCAAALPRSILLAWACAAPS
eukprot:5477850-Pleurochrysis_carterae.AAC.4